MHNKLKPWIYSAVLLNIYVCEVALCCHTSSILLVLLDP